MAGSSIKGITVEIGGNTGPIEKAFQGVNKTSRDLQSELTQVNKLLKLDPTNVDLLNQKQKILAGSVSTTKEKLQTLKLAEAQAQEQFKKGKISEEQYRALQREVINTEQSLKHLESQALKAQAVLSKDQATNNLKNMGKAAVVAGAAVAAAFVAMGVKALESAGELQKFSDQTGFTAERIQELAYVGKQIDMDFETLIKSQTKLTRGMAQAKDGNKAQAESFKELGIEILGSDGKLRDSKEVMLEVVDALGGMKNETERDAVSLKIFGKSALELNPLIKAGSTEIAKFSKEARDTGAVMSNEAVAGLDTFGDSMESLGQSIMGSVGSNLAKLMPQIQDLITKLTGLPQWIKENTTTLKILGIGIGTVTVAYIAFNVQQLLLASGLTLTTAMSGLATVAITGLRVAFAFLTGPVGLTVLALGAVAAVMVLTSEESSKATEKIKTLAKSCNDSSKTFDTQTGAIKADAAMAKTLADELYKLEGKQNKTGTETARMSLLVGQLNKLIPNLNLAINTQTGALNMNKDAVLGNVKAMKEQALAAAYVARVTELYKEKIVLEEQSIGVATRLAKANKVVEAAAKDRYIATIFQIDEQKKAKEASDLLAASHDKNAKSTKFVEKAYTEMAVSVAANNKKIVVSGEETTELTAEQLKQQEADVKEHDAAIEKATQDHLSQMGGIEAKGIEQTKLTAKQFLKNLQQQVKDMENWRTQLKALATKVPVDVYNELEKLGPSSASLLQDMNKLSGPELDVFVQLFRQKFGLAYDTAVDEVDGLPGAVYAIGANAGQGFANGISIRLPNVAFSAGQIASVTSSSVLSILGPMATTGANAGQSYANGISGKKPEVAQAAGSLANTANANASTSLYDIGVNVGSSFADGIRSQISDVRQAAGMIARATGSSVMSILNIRSPSKVMAGLGGYVSEGFAKGITDNIDMVKKAAGGIAESTKNAISGLFSDVNIGMHLTPAMAGMGGVGSIADQTKSTETVTNGVVVQNMYVRNDNDIKLVAKELYSLQRGRSRGQGVTT